MNTLQAKSPVLQPSLQWYAVYTKSNYERRVYDMLIWSGVEAYCPMQKKIRQWSDRKKIIWQPVLRGYVLVKVSSTEFEKVRRIEGVANFVYHNGKPGIIRECEIDLMKRFFEDFMEEKVSIAYFSPGDRVTITSGPFLDYCGTVVDVKNHTVRLRLKFLNMELEAITSKEKLVKYIDSGLSLSHQLKSIN